MKSTKRPEVLNQRGAVYGRFSDNARDAATIRKILLEGVDDPVLREAIDYIIKKLVRLKGDPHFIDTYRDIAGYATLAVEYLEGESPVARDVEVRRKEKGVDGVFSFI